MNVRAIPWKERGTIFLRLLLPIIGALILIAVPEVRAVLPAEGGDSLYVSVLASVKWEETIPDVWRDTGQVNILISGTMERNDAGSPVISKKGSFFRPVLNYTAGTMTVTYIYSDSSQSIGPKKPGECENRAPTTHHGTIFSDGNQSARLSINMLSSMAEPFLKNLTPAQKQFAAQFQQSGPIPDWYQFAVGGSGREIIPGSTQSSEPGCEMVYHEIRAPQFSLGLQMQLPSSGLMEGSRRWSAGAEGRPSFKIGICDVNHEGFSKPLNPEEGGKGNASYSVSWYLGERKLFPEEVKDGPKKDCIELANRIKLISIILETYSDPLLRNKIVSEHGENAMKEYQDAVEKQAMKKVPRPAGTPAPEAKANMWTTPFTDLPPGTAGATVTDVTINANVGGENTVLIDYDGQGNEVGGNYDAFEEMLTEWEGTYGEDAGRIRLNASIAHEKVHVKQYTDPKRGIAETVDDMRDYEREAYAEELDYLMKEMQDMDCF